MLIIHDMDNTYLPRLLQSPLAGHLRTMPAVVVTGARQTGKSTLVQALVDGERRFLTLDDLDVAGLARSDPEALVGGSAPVTLDEVQREPEVLIAVKRAIDRKRRPGQFLLTGSADLLLMRRVSESLAGRASYLAPGPMRIMGGTARSRRAQLDSRASAGEKRAGRLEEFRAARWLSGARRAHEVGLRSRRVVRGLCENVSGTRSSAGFVDLFAPGHASTHAGSRATPGPDVEPDGIGAGRCYATTNGSSVSEPARSLIPGDSNPGVRREPDQAVD